MLRSALERFDATVPGKAGTIDRGRDGRGRMTVLAFGMTPPWGAPKIRNPNGLSIGEENTPTGYYGGLKKASG